LLDGQQQITSPDIIGKVAHPEERNLNLGDRCFDVKSNKTKNMSGRMQRSMLIYICCKWTAMVCWLLLNIYR